MNPNYAEARRHATRRLTRELPPEFSYHSLAHTLDVIERCIDLAERIGVQEEEMLLLSTAAAYHDIGFLEQPDGHEAIGATYAGQVLGRFGYSAQQIATVQQLIRSTQLGQPCDTLLEQIISDADLDVLGRTDFMMHSLSLHEELVALGAHITKAQWYVRQLRFLEAHVYRTATARELRDAGKARNSAELVQLIAAIDAA